MLTFLYLLGSSAHALSGDHAGKLSIQWSAAAGSNADTTANYSIEHLSLGSQDGILRSPAVLGFSHDYAQGKNGQLKSRGEVMSEIKRRYDAKILKITLDQVREVYVVRLLMPNGKVKAVRVSARR